RSGDSLWTIAQRFGTTVSAIRTANNLKTDLLSIGQRLIIPGR
ncbi:MAG: LysM peptidoglycan-binding domain-containing protein, partial [Bacilli bacterium]